MARGAPYLLSSGAFRAIQGGGRGVWGRGGGGFEVGL